MPPPSPLTICICTHNRGPEIEPTLDAMARQGDNVAAIVVIDNNSSDDTAEIVDRFIAANPAVPMRRMLEMEQGLLHARLRGAAECKSPLIAFVDDDVLLNPGWAAAIVARFEASPGCGVVGGEVRLRWLSGPTRLAQRHQVMLASQNLGTSPRELSDPGQALVGAAIVFRVEALRESGWTERPLMTDRCGDVMTSGGDTEMVIRVRQSGFAAWYEPAARCDHLIPPERQSRGYLLRLMRGISASEPWVKWIAEGAPRDDVARAWLDTNLNRYRRQIRKTRLFEWRPDRRAFLLARREARAEGYRSLARSLEDGSV